MDESLKISAEVIQLVAYKIRDNLAEQWPQIKKVSVEILDRKVKRFAGRAKTSHGLLLPETNLYVGSKIQISLAIFEIPENFRQCLHLTVIHELAHCVAGFSHDEVENHGPVWKAVCIAMGGDGKRYLDLPVPVRKPKTRIWCADCGKVHAGSTRVVNTLHLRFCAACKSKNLTLENPNEGD